MPIRLLFWAFFALYLLGAYWGMPSALTPAVDSISPLGPLAFVAKYRQADITYVYPAVHQLVQIAAYAVVLGGAKLTGALGAVSSVWPYGFRDPSAMFTVLLVVSNAIAAAMGAGLLRTLFRMRPGPEAAQWFAIPLLGLSGVFAYYTRTANMDIPYLFWLVLAWHRLWVYFTDKPAARDLWLAGLFSALAFGSKDQASTVIFGFGLLLLFLPAEGGVDWKARFRQAAVFSLAVGIFYALFAIAPQPARWWYHVQHVTQNPVVHIAPETPPGFWGQILLLERCYLRLHHIFTYAGLPLALAGIVLLWRAGRRRELALLLVPAATYYLFVIARVRAPEERYLLPIVIPFTLCAGVAVGALRRRGWIVAGAVLAAQFVFSFVPVTYAQLFDTKRDMAAEMPRHLPPGSPLAVYGMQTLGFPNRTVYENYRLMLMPGQEIVPPSTHAGQLLSSYDATAAAAVTREAVPPPGDGWRLTASWRYPDWIRRHVHVPAIHELYLYRRSAP